MANTTPCFSSELADACQVHKSSLVCVQTIFNCLQLVPEYKERLDAHHAAESEALGEKADTYREKFAE